MTRDQTVATLGATVALATVLAVTLALAGVAVALPADGGSSFALQDGNETVQDGNETALVRVVHASPDAPNVDVLVDNETALEDVPFGTISDFIELPAGEHQITITAAGDPGTVVFDETATFDAGVGHTLIALGEVTEGQPVPLDVGFLVGDAMAPDSADAMVRLAHLSPDAPAVDVTVAETGDVLFDNVSFGTVTPYATVPAGDYTLEVRAEAADDNGTVVSTFDVTLEGGTANTALAVGYLDPAVAPGDQAFDLLLTTDRALSPENVTVPAATTETSLVEAANETMANETAG